MGGGWLNSSSVGHSFLHVSMPSLFFAEGRRLEKRPKSWLSTGGVLTVRGEAFSCCVIYAQTNREKRSLDRPYVVFLAAAIPIAVRQWHRFHEADMQAMQPLRWRARLGVCCTALWV